MENYVLNLMAEVKAKNPGGVRLDSEMLPNYDDFLIKRFEQPDEVRTFEKGKFDTGEEGWSLEFRVLSKSV
jgi:hypothetical protein